MTEHDFILAAFDRLGVWARVKQNNAWWAMADLGGDLAYAHAAGVGFDEAAEWAGIEPALAQALASTAPTPAQVSTRRRRPLRKAVRASAERMRATIADEHSWRQGSHLLLDELPRSGVTVAGGLEVAGLTPQDLEAPAMVPTPDAPALAEAVKGPLSSETKEFDRREAARRPRR